MNNNDTPIELLFERAEDYTKTTLELFKLRAISKSADATSYMVAAVVISVFVVLFSIMLSCGVAIWLGQLMGDLFLGFFIVAGVYAIIIALLFLFRKQWIGLPVANAVINSFLK
ncbi:MAG: hypothetical protein IPM91_00545 [Bacteroidetes bacterium]|jgi:hypothetical protein|nr:hypothetical protein [Bacteroidota bacterium]